MRPTVLLFDIDGTLLSSMGVGRKALDRAFELLHGRPDAVNFALDGMTDGCIVQQALQGIGASADDESVGRVLDAYIDALEVGVAQASDENYRLHVGMREAVALGLAQKNTVVGLGTGNIRRGAKIKLDRVALYEPFQFGGFGCDHNERGMLIRRGAERGAALLNLSLEACRVVVIGDTPKDIHAAQFIGAESVGVGTGRFAPAQLLAAGATAAFADLSAPGALAAVLGEA